MEDFKTWLTIVRDSFAIIGIGLAFWRIYVMRYTFFSDHDRSRRLSALDMIKFWTKSLTQKSSLARKLVESFSDDQCQSLSNQNSFNIDSNKKDLLIEYFGKENITESDNLIKLNEGQSSILRWEIISYLNQLETVLIAWRHNIADKEILEEEFNYLYKPEKGHTLIEKFRIATGIDSYPGIKEFVDSLKKQAEKKTKKGKKKI